MKKLALASSYTISGSRIYYTKCKKITEDYDINTVKECGLYSMKLDGSDKKQEKSTKVSWAETKGYDDGSVTVSGKTYSVVKKNGTCKLICKNKKTGKSKTIYKFSGTYVESFEILGDMIILVQPIKNGYHKIVYMDLNGKNRITLKKNIAVG
jgi:hypothetical protein